ncbi:DUF1344 domain-containing protein [Devosia sp.]|uniref:DUF1344 domain-containing protein n=1 Tax=Devosia sp. TaxID=1871048 RepID=UPI003BACCD1A
MRNLLIPFVLVASIGASSMAFAAATVTDGAIASMDAKACTVTLADKSVYQFPAKCDFSKLKAGEKVAITWAANGKVNDATLIVAAK